MADREVRITRNYLLHPPGSVLIEFGRTKVICSVNYEPVIPQFLKEHEEEQGWLTAEYSMIPGATDRRFRRERSRIGGRTSEIQRLIGRSLRAALDLHKIPGITLYVDCDVIQADGGTRTAAITGACVALHDALQILISRDIISRDPFINWLAAVSVGIVDGKVTTDLCYDEDSRAQVDMNLVITESGEFVEIQGTAEAGTFDAQQLNDMLRAGQTAIRELIRIQKASLEG